MLPISSTTGWMYPIMKGWSAHRAPGAPSPTRDILRSFPQSILLMTITCRIPLVMLFISPARGGANDPVDTRPYSHFTGSDELFNGGDTSPYDYMGGSKATAKVSAERRGGGKVCKLEWGYSEPLEPAESGIGYKPSQNARLDLEVRLDPGQEAFTYISAISKQNFYRRDLIVEENDAGLNVKAFVYGKGESGWVYPEISAGAAGTAKRQDAEEALSQGGPYSPLAHLKGEKMGPLLQNVGWMADFNDMACRIIYNFIANNAPDGYSSGNFDWLYEFVENNAERIQRNIENWEGVSKALKEQPLLRHKPTSGASKKASVRGAVGKIVRKIFFPKK